MAECMEQISVEEARAIQIELLDELDRFCNHNGIRYFIIAGTLLGAIRHQGYIPWDDDIDVVMLRDDYERFANGYRSGACYIASAETLKGYTLPFMKFCKQGTRTLENPKILDCDIGINIDIFPIDNVPDEEKEQAKLLRRNDKYKYILGLKWGVESSRNGLLVRIGRKGLGALLKVVSYPSLVNKMNKNASQYNARNTRQCSEVIWGCGKLEFVSVDVFRDTVDLDFEGKRYKAPVGWREWLSNRYGDYMELPPKEQQVPHHDRQDFIIREM